MYQKDKDSGTDMNALDNLLKTHQDSEELDFETIWKEGTFVFDSNVLLDLYRLPESASDDLIKVLKSKNFNPRIWVGFQVILEFLNNRHNTIGDQKSKFNEVKILINEALSKFDTTIQELQQSLNKLKLNERHSVIEPDKYITQKNIADSKKFLDKFVKELDDLEKDHPDVHQTDKFKQTVLAIFEGKVGDAFTEEELKEIYENGESRYKKKIPPGFKDDKKDESYFVNGLEFKRKFGDLLLWHEIIQKANIDKIKHLVLVTGDVKEDWWLKKRGKNLNARLELLDEIYSKSPELQSFYMYDTSSFLRNAKTYLDLDISEDTIEQTNDLIRVNNKKTNFYDKKDGLADFIEIVKFLSNKFDDLKVYIHSSVELIPPILIPEFVPFLVISEIFGNASQHSSDKVLQITASLVADSHIDITFRNKVKIFSSDDKSGTWTKENSQKDPARGHGLRAITNELKSIGAMTYSTFDDYHYSLTIRFPWKLLIK